MPLLVASGERVRLVAAEAALGDGDAIAAAGEGEGDGLALAKAVPEIESANRSAEAVRRR
jgi:hypothetical protein